MKKTVILVLITLCFHHFANPQDIKFEWAKGMGGSNNDNVGSSIVVDTSGNVFTTGHFYGTIDFDPGPGTFNITTAGFSCDIFVQKLDSSGNFVWVKRIGGTGSDVGYSISVDVLGNVYIKGIFWDTVDFDPGPGSYQLTAPGGFGIFVLKLNASGNFVWAKQIGGGNTNNGNLLVVDATGNVYITGSFQGTLDFDPGPSTHNLISNGFEDIFILKLDSSGNFVWAKQLGGYGLDIGNSIALDAYGNVYITGSFSGTVDFDPGPGSFILTSSGGLDIFILKLNTTGNFIYTGKIGGIGGEIVHSIAVDAWGNVLTTGTFTGTVDFDPSLTGTYNLSAQNPKDIFVHKLNASGNFLWVKQTKSPHWNDRNTIALDVLGNVYIIGNFGLTTDFDPSLTETYNLTSAGGPDIFIQKLDASGNFVCAKRMGGTGGDKGYSIALDDLGNVYTTGWFTDTVDFNPGSGTYYLTFAGASNIFVQKLSPCIKSDSTITKTACESYTSPSGNHVWASSGTYRDTIPNAYDCDSIITINLTIKNRPAANFTINDTTQCMGANMFIFSDTSIISNDSSSGNTISFYNWIFGDSSFSSIKNPTHHFSNPDTFNVQLTAISNNNCKDSVSKKVYVHPNPDGSFSVNDSGQCFAGNKFSFTNSSSISSGSLSFEWDFGDGSGSFVTDPSYSYNMDSTYMVKLLSLSGFGCWDSVYKQLAVYPMPNASFGINDSVQCFINNSFVFINLSSIDSGNISFVWNFGDTTSSVDTSPVHQYNASDTFYVSLIVSTNEACRDTIVKPLIVHPSPVSGFIFQDSFQCLENNDFVFVNTSSISSGKLTYLWKFGDNDTSTLVNPQHSYEYTDTFTVKLIATSGIGCKDSISSGNIYVDLKPYAVYSVNDSIQCLNGNIFSFTNLSIINFGSFASFWDFGDSNSSIIQNPSHSYTVADSYLVSLTVSANGKCKDTSSKYVYVNNNPIADFLISNPCKSDSTLFISNSNSGNPNDEIVNYQWKYGDGSEAIIFDNPKHMYNDTGIYSVTLIIFTNTGCIDTIIKTVQIHPQPNIALTGDTIIIPGQSGSLQVVGSFDSILWSTGDFSQTIIVTDSGFYSIRIVDYNGCSITDSIKVMVISNQIIIMNTITPNGDEINDKWIILNNQGYSPVSVNIYNKWGDEVYSSINYVNDWEGTWKGKQLSEGTYYYILKTKQGNIYKGSVNILR